MAADSLIVTMQVSNYNGFEVSCFGEKDGWIDLSVSGGQPPYSYEWSNGSNEPHMVDLAAGYYKVDVIDADGQRVTKEVTLDQPLAMKLDVDVYEYANGYNISCYQCSNGNASVVVLGGAPPFTITWSDGPTGSNRYNLAAKDYKITAADGNGCAGTSITIYLRGPDRSDWSMSGNAGTTPGPQYIGTPDNKDVVFKSNGQERLRLQADGQIGLWAADTVAGPLYRDFDGTLKIGGGPDYPTLDPQRCFELRGMPYWQTRGNDFTHLCPDQQPILGTLDNSDLNIITWGEQRMRITRNGAVGIGTNPPSGAVGSYRLFVEDGIVCRDVLVKMGDWPDYVFQPNYALMPMDAMRQYLRINKHLPGIPSAAELEAKQGVEVGDLQARMLKVVEDQQLYILQLEERQSQLETRLKALETAQHR